MLRVLMKKVSSVQEQMDDISREMDTIINNQKKMLEI